MTIDHELVTRKLLLITRDLEALRALDARDRAAFLGNPMEQAAAERLLERMIGRMIDVSYHLITESGQPPPPDYYTSFVTLGDLGVLDADFARRIAPCAGLRNRLVHEYEAIDPLKVFDALEPARTDILAFVQAIQAYLDRLAPDT